MSLEQGFVSMVRPWARAAGVWRPKNAAIRNRTMAPYMAVSVTSTGIPASVNLTRHRERVYPRQYQSHFPFAFSPNSSFLGFERGGRGRRTIGHLAEGRLPSDEKPLVS